MATERYMEGPWFNGSFTADLTNSYASMTHVRRGNMVDTGTASA